MAEVQHAQQGAAKESASCQTDPWQEPLSTFPSGLLDACNAAASEQQLRQQLAKVRSLGSCHAAGVMWLLCQGATAYHDDAQGQRARLRS